MRDGEYEEARYDELMRVMPRRRAAMSGVHALLKAQTLAAPVYASALCAIGCALLRCARGAAALSYDFVSLPLPFAFSIRTCCCCFRHVTYARFEAFHVSLLMLLLLLPVSCGDAFTCQRYADADYS